MLQLNGNGNGKRISAKNVLTWLVPALLAFLSVGVYSTWQRVSDIHDMQAAITTRITAIEYSRFTTADGLELWREVGTKVDRDELYIQLAEIKELIRGTTN